MATTIRSDIFVPEVLEEAVRGEFAGMTALYGTGAAAVSARGWPDARGGDTITVPYFGTIGEWEDLASNEGAGGAVPALTPVKITQTTETATVQHSGKAFQITEWARLAGMYDDPYAELARQVRVGWERRADAALLTEAATTTLVHDIYDDAAAANGVLTWQQILKARFLWGDEQDDIVLVTMHSDVLLDLLSTVETDGAGSTNRALYDAAIAGEMIRMPGVGVPIRLSDRTSKEVDFGGANDVDRYKTHIYKRGALAFWFNGGDTEIQTDKDILADNHVGAMHTYYVAHLYSRTPGATKPGVVEIRHNISATTEAFLES